MTLMSEQADKGRRIERVRALTTLSPVVPTRRHRLTFLLWLVRWLPNGGRPLQELAFIHYGRWTVLRALPDPSGSGERRRLSSRYLLFESNFDGGLSDYLDAFADTVPHRLARLWGQCIDFEPSVMKTRGAEGREVSPWAFRRYVARNELEVLHFYAAYPRDTVIAVRQAIQFQGLPEDERLEAAFGPVPDNAGRREKLVRIFREWRSATRGNYGVSPFTLITPIKPARYERLVTHLRRLPSAGSPLARLNDTHYARFVLIPTELVDLGQKHVDRLATPYLLYTSNHCGPATEHIAAIENDLAEEADEIWGCCEGYPGRGSPDFTAWFDRHSFDTDYFVGGYAAHSPAQIRHFVKVRRDYAQVNA
jgi:hypothetical protein